MNTEDLKKGEGGFVHTHEKVINTKTINNLGCGL